MATFNFSFAHMKKQFSIGIILSLVSQFLSAIIWFFFKPFLINVLGNNEYGLYQLIQSVINFLNLLYFGFNGAYIRYYSIAKKKNQDEVANVNGMFLKVFFALSAICALAGIFILIFLGSFFDNLSTNDLLLAEKMFVILLINLVLSFPMTLFTVYISANERFVFQKLLAILLNLLQPVLSIPILLQGCGSVGVVSVTLLISVFRFVLVIAYCVCRLNIQINCSYFEKSILSELLKYTFFIFLSDTVDQLNSNVDSILLGKLIGTSSVTLYSVGYDFRNYYILFSWIIPELYIPKANRLAVSGENNNELTALFTQIGRYNNYILMFLFTSFLLVGKQFINLWIGKGYDKSFYVGVILIAAAYIPSVQTLGVNIQNAKNKHQSRSIVYFIIACLNVILSVGLIRNFQEVGTSIGTLISVTLGCGLYMNYYYYRHLHLNIFYFWKKIIKWTLFSLLLCLFLKLCIYNYNFDNLFKILIFIAIYSLIYIAVMYFFGVEKEERIKILSFLNR